MFQNIHWHRFIQENDDDSFSHIYKEHVKDLYTYGTSLGFAADTCMDAIQDVFYKLYIRKNEFRHIANIRFYLFRSFRNRLLDVHKQLKNWHRIEEKADAFPIEVSVSERIEDEEDRRILTQKVETLLNLLTSRQREAVYLRYMQNLEYDEIAAIMQMNPESVRKLVYRALEAIRKNVKNTPFRVILGAMALKLVFHL